MDRVTFDSLIEDLFNHYGFKQPDNRRIELLFRQVKHIPLSALGFIKNKAFNWDTVPRNLSKKINALYYEWKNTAPDELKNQFETTTCDVCSGEGVLFAEKKDFQYQQMYSYVFRCGRCENWKKRFGPDSPVPIAQSFELQNKGFSITNQANRPAPGTHKKARYDIDDPEPF